jgi:hypothetical protein
MLSGERGSGFWLTINVGLSRGTIQMRIEEEHPDILQNIEFVVAGFYRDNPDMTDYAVLRTYEALLKTYTAEAKNRVVPAVKAVGLEAELFNAVRSICETRLGRSQISAPTKDVAPIAPVDIATIVSCLKRLVKSVQKWNRHYGRQGYLNYMVQFMRSRQRA